MRFFFLYLILILLLSSCTSSTEETTKLENKTGAVINTIEDTIYNMIDVQKTIASTSIERPYSRKTARQNFILNTSKDTIIIGKEGSIFLIPKNSLVDSKGAVVRGKVKLTLVEAYSLEDMLKEKLQTISSKGLLITSGMFSITAQDTTGQSLYLAKDKMLYFQMTKRQNKKNELYTLNENYWVNPVPPTNYLTYKPFDFNPTNSGIDECYAIMRVYINNLLESDIQKKEISKSFIFSQEYFERHEQLFCNDGYRQIILEYLANYKLPLVEADKKVLTYIKENEKDSDKKTKIIKRLNNYIKENKTRFPPDFVYPKVDYKYMYKQSASEFVIYGINLLGWCNIDRAFPNMKKVKQTITIKTNQSVNSLFLVAKYKGVSLLVNTSQKPSSKQHTITRELPQGVDFYLIALSIKKDKLFYGEKEIKTKGDCTEEVILKPISKLFLQKRLTSIQRNWGI